MSTLFPLWSLESAHREVGLVVALAIGFAFGFVLERAGFGRAPKLAGQFYFTEQTVLKVMFGAIVTAMLGLVVASGLGLVDLRMLREFAASPTYLWPMLVGGLVLGVGFIVAGYCPGTSIVSAASGNVDGMVTVGGVVAGTLVYTELQPRLGWLHDSGHLGHRFLYDLLGVPFAVLAAGVTLLAIGMFVGGELLERHFGGKAARAAGLEPPASARRPRRFAFATLGAVAALGLVTLAVPRPGRAVAERPARVAAPIDAEELARRVIEEPWRLRVLDLRPEAACAERRVPGAECAPPESLGALALADDASGRDLVLVGGGDLAEVPAAAGAYPGRLLALQGGFAAWQAYALAPPAPIAPEATAAERARQARRAGIHAMMTGTKQAPPPPPATGGGAAPKRKGGGGCGG